MNTTLDEISDVQLMEEIAAQAPSALDELHRRYHVMLKSVIMKVLHDSAEADDVLQEVLLQVWERGESYSSEKGKPCSWLFTVARRRAIDRVRHNVCYNRVTDRYETLCKHPDKELAELHPVETTASNDDLKQLLLDHIDALPESQQEVIRLAYFENKSQRDISSFTGTPLGTVKTRLELGLKKLSYSLGSIREKVA